MTTITPPPVPADEYIDNLWKAVKAKLITWPELNDLQAAYLRDQRPIPLPRLCRCGRPTRPELRPAPRLPRLPALRAHGALPRGPQRRRGGRCLRLGREGGAGRLQSWCGGRRGETQGVMSTPC